jgi:hypothetical protein
VPNNYHVLGQANPPAATLTVAYTVPAATSVVVSTIKVCNRSATPTLFRVSIAVAGVGDDPKQYIYYDNAIPWNRSFGETEGITLAAGDVVRVYATLATLTFSIFGNEIT